MDCSVGGTRFNHRGRVRRVRSVALVFRELPERPRERPVVAATVHHVERLRRRGAVRAPAQRTRQAMRHLLQGLQLCPVPRLPTDGPARWAPRQAALFLYAERGCARRKLAYCRARTSPGMRTATALPVHDRLSQRWRQGAGVRRVMIRIPPVVLRKRDCQALTDAGLLHKCDVGYWARRCGHNRMV